jgi:hypothetical protein
MLRSVLTLYVDAEDTCSNSALSLPEINIELHYMWHIPTKFNFCDHEHALSVWSKQSRTKAISLAAPLFFTLHLIIRYIFKMILCIARL